MDSLETPRLLLRPFAPDDAVLVHAVYSDPEVMRYVATGPMADIALTGGCSRTTTPTSAATATRSGP